MGLHGCTLATAADTRFDFYHLMFFHALVLLVALSANLQADIIAEVRAAVRANDSKLAASVLVQYRDRHGVDPEYLEALSWMARGELATGELERALDYGVKTEKQILPLLEKRKLDEQAHLAIALGAALEVQAQALARQGKTDQAVQLLRNALRRFGNTSIHSRLQKSLNLLTLAGRPAPPLSITEYLGERPKSLAELRGSVVLIFFWAHWCGDCKAQAPVIARVQLEFSNKDLIVLGPTQRYGYAGQREDISPDEESRFIDSVRQRYYGNFAVPLSKENFDRYGASTTPTLVLVDRSGIVALYHPGTIGYDELRGEIAKLVTRQ
jgi:thiol-disulfide isomerase/thioredoxin